MEVWGGASASYVSLEAGRPQEVKSFQKSFFHEGCALNHVGNSRNMSYRSSNYGLVYINYIPVVKDV